MCTMPQELQEEEEEEERDACKWTAWRKVAEDDKCKKQKTKIKTLQAGIEVPVWGELSGTHTGQNSFKCGINHLTMLVQNKTGEQRECDKELCV